MLKLVFLRQLSDPFRLAMEPKWNRDGTTQAADSCHGGGVNAVGDTASPQTPSIRKELMHATLAALQTKHVARQNASEGFAGTRVPTLRTDSQRNTHRKNIQSTAANRELPRWGSDTPPWGQHTPDFASKTLSLVVTLKHLRPVHAHTNELKTVTASRPSSPGAVGTPLALPMLILLRVPLATNSTVRTQSLQTLRRPTEENRPARLDT